MARLTRLTGVLLLALALSSACGGTTVTAGPSLPGGQSAAPSTPPGTEPTASAPASSPGEASPAPGSATPSSSTGPAAASPSAPLTGAAGCSGNHDNRVFFDAIAGQVTWNVYCAVLPDGWFVQTGSFSLRNGGRMTITYRGPGGALLTLEEGNVCEGQANGCPPSGQQIGPASFGDQAGLLLRLDSAAGYAINVDPGSFPSWSATGAGLDEAAFTALAAALLHVVD
jgi:hypothetical protein